MYEWTAAEHDQVLIRTVGACLHIRLNRPEALNSLSLNMVRRIASALDAAKDDNEVRCVVLTGEGSKGFCAGGDIKWVALQVRSGARADAQVFFREEYALDLTLHKYPKPVIVVAHGVTMGGGLGLAAGADVVVATETTHMAMPETRIGFFPDVGSTSWLFTKCPPGYPEYLALTGDDVYGPHAVRLGLATHFLQTQRLGDFIRQLEHAAPRLPDNRAEAARRLREVAAAFEENTPLPQDPEMDAWVRTYFHHIASIPVLLSRLSQCQVQSRLCEGVFRRLSERSPTAVTLTLALLKIQQGRPIEEVFAVDERAARWIIEHHDFWEGVRARLVDKDNHPRWDPARFEDVLSIDTLKAFLLNPQDF